MRHRVASCLAVLAIAAFAGCGKKHAPPPPPPPPTAETGTPPTATITATPDNIAAGDKVILTWKTTDATDVSIDGIGAVPSSGTQTVSPTQTTDYHLVARGLGGSTDATAHVMVGSGATTGELGGETVDDATFHTNVQDIFFDYDSYDVTQDAASTLSADAAWLNQHADVKIVIGGYCDERGSNEYNLTLGESRASSVKNALVQAGIASSRIRVISYGKEKPFCTESTEECWQKNRRAGFSIDR